MSRNVALNKDEGFIWWLKTSWDWALMRCFYGDRNSRPYIMELGGPFWKVKGQSQKSHTRPCDVHDELKKHLDDWNIWRVPNVWEQTVFVRGPNAKVNCCSPWSSTFSSAKAPVVVDFNACLLQLGEEMKLFQEGWENIVTSTLSSTSIPPSLSSSIIWWMLCRASRL